jgi:hypothetical protein
MIRTFALWALPAAALLFGQDSIGFKFENQYYSADLTARERNGKVLEDNGTLRGLTFKPTGTLIQRSGNRMHWAPSFQRSGAKNYLGIGTWNPVQKHSKTENKERVRFTRSGYMQEYPEVHLFAEYDFLKNEPYFLFRSTMTIEKPVEMFWLRNQEMTMDHIFTHVAFPNPDGSGKVMLVDFEERKPILAAKPLPVDVPWVAFVNLEKGFGYGAVVLKYKAGTTANPITSINDGVNPPARYWDRRLVNQKDTPLKVGDKYEEETAYVLFKVPAAKDKALDEFFALRDKIVKKYGKKK